MNHSVLKSASVYSAKLPAINAMREHLAEHAIDAAAQVNSGRFITEGQELELITVLQSIVNGFSDDPAHDAAAPLKRITGEVPWAGDSFQLPPRQGGEPCATEPPSSSPA